jgi:hypothetical protein
LKLELTRIFTQSNGPSTMLHDAAQQVIRSRWLGVYEVKEAMGKNRRDAHTRYTGSSIHIHTDTVSMVSTSVPCPVPSWRGDVHPWSPTWLLVGPGMEPRQRGVLLCSLRIKYCEIAAGLHRMLLLVAHTVRSSWFDKCLMRLKISRSLII